MPTPLDNPHHSPARPFDALLCDVDGCLTPEHHKPFDAGRLLEVRRHNELAIADRDRPVVTLCTGRPVGFVESLCRLIGNDQLPICAENGVWLWDPTENSFHRDPNITEAHIEAVHAAERWVRTELTPKGFLTQPGKTCSLSLYHPDPDTLHAAADTVRKRFERESWPFRVSATWLWINCDLEFVSKATAIDRFIERTGIPTERLCGIGDTGHDKFIRDRVAWFACPANAQDGIKQHADYISEHDETEGVLDILARLRSFEPA